MDKRNNNESVQELSWDYNMTFTQLLEGLQEVMTVNNINNNTCTLKKKITIKYIIIGCSKCPEEK